MIIKIKSSKKLSYAEHKEKTIKEKLTKEKQKERKESSHFKRGML